MVRIAVVGASGFVGTTLVERLQRRADCEVLPLIHSTGGASRLARLGIPLHRVDLMDVSRIRETLFGSTHVVNCSRGTDEVMLTGHRNLLRACFDAGVKRVVHLSSVMVYGDPPSPASIHEDAKPNAQPRRTYGWIKWKQDEWFFAASRKGLPCVVLCPPVISGPYSPGLLGLLEVMRQRRFALVGDGEAPCNLVDVRNLCKAIELALFSNGGTGKRIFVTDNAHATWGQLAEALAPLVEHPLPIPSVSPDEAQFIAARKRRWSFRATLRHLVSNKVRAVLREDPLLAALDSFGSRISRRLGIIRRRKESFGNTCREVPPSYRETRPSLDVLSLKRQLRAVRHSCELAQSELGYFPEVSFEQSLEDFRDWYAAIYGWRGPYWDLLRFLWQCQ